jgi:signal transduction histidine kinase
MAVLKDPRQRVDMQSGMSAAGPNALWAILDAVRDAPEYRDFLLRVIVALRANVGCDRATLYLLSRRRNSFVPAADDGTPPHVVADFLSRGYTRRSFPEDRELREDVMLHAVRGQCSTEMEQLLAQASLYALVLVPLVHRDEVTGTVVLGSERAPGFAAAQLELIASLAQPVASLVRSARIEYEQGRLAARRTRLASLASEVLTASEPEVMATRVCAASRAIFRASRADLMMLDGEFLVAQGADSDGVAELSPRRPIDDAPILSESVRERRVVAVNDFMASGYARSQRAHQLRPASVLAIPLADDEGALGVLVVSDTKDKHRFAPRDQEDAALLGTIATDAIRKRLLVESLRRASAAKSEFLASVSHDLRTPLNVILGYTDLLAEETFGPVTTDQLDTLGRMRRTAAAQLALIDDLLDLARIEQGKLGVQLHPVAVAELVGPLREMMDALLHERPIVFEVDVAGDAVARTDRERLRQVLVNLLANAAKFTQRGVVRLSARRVERTVEITVVDSGCGMPPELTQQALEPFVRGTDPRAGSGLGLAIVARMLAVLEGTIAIDSAIGHGTVVRVELPAS